MAQENTTGKGVLWLKLDNASRRRLRELYPPKYPNEFYDHVTLAFGVPKNSVEHLIGTTAQATVYAHAQNDKTEAVRVTTDNLPDTYGVPHVTLSTQSGIEPFESVAMLQGDHEESAISPPFVITGTIQFIPL